MPDSLQSVPFSDHIPYGVWGCAARTEGGRAAIIVTWLAQLSFEPLLLGISLESGGEFLHHVLLSREFTLSALPRDRGKLIARGILKAGMRVGTQENTALFSTMPEWEDAVGGAVAAVRCRVVSHHPAGDHTFIEGTVIREHQWSTEEVLHLSDTGWKYRPTPPKQHRLQ